VDRPGFIRLSLATQTAYARLLDQLLTAEIDGLPAGASLVSKLIGGHRYWYLQRTQDGKKRQTYLGRQTPELEVMVETRRRTREDAAARAETIAMARAGGALVPAAAEARVFELLSDVFRMGGVLVGSHAFAVLGNALGVRWQDAIVRTEDIDIAHDHRISVALSEQVPPINLPKALGDVIPRLSILNPTEPATSFHVRGTQIDVDLLTPLVGRERPGPIRIEALDAAATSLRFLDYLIEETQPAAIVGASGVLVNLPRPGRFALHKLVVASRRAAAGATKATKDRAQATVLLRVLLADLPGEITLAWKALSSHGRAGIKAARDSLARLDGDVRAGLEPLGIKPSAR